MAGAEVAVLRSPALLCVLMLLGLQRPVAGRELKFVNLVGMKQHYALGQYLRHRYHTFLNSSYDQHEVYVQSTDIDRTLMSAQVNLAGLYPPQGHQIFHPDLKWQPIPVHTVPVEQDEFLKFPRKNCPRFQKLLEETLNSREVRKKIQKNTDFLNMVSSNTKMNVTMQNEWKVYDTLFCEKTHNFTLPSWATHEVITRMGELNDFGMEILFQLHKTQEKSRLQGVLMKGLDQMLPDLLRSTSVLCESLDLFLLKMEQTARKRKSFSVRDKLHRLDAIKTKSQTQVAGDLRVPESTLRGWKSHKEKFCALICKVEEEAGPKARHLKTAKGVSLDDSLYEWFVQVHSEGLPISSPILKVQAKKFDKQINGETSQFKASNGWLTRFKRHYGITFLRDKLNDDC
ncbi:prostatic acid phosphatase-like isoform X3 [Hemitrygon akajei]|uniref:prostatic acid phosphatase-like isoform X3 n=1 Tax=Hemitrygon akajei TaxID=2704970 RepID=UPI003BF9ED5A